MKRELRSEVFLLPFRLRGHLIATSRVAPENTSAEIVVSAVGTSAITNPVLSEPNAEGAEWPSRHG
jgi:hypothetical protein